MFAGTSCKHGKAADYMFLEISNLNWISLNGSEIQFQNGHKNSFLAHRKEGEKGQLKTPKVNTAAEAPCYTPMTQANSRGAAYDKQIRTYLCMLTWGFIADSESGQNVWNTGFLKHLDTVIFLKIA